MREKGYCYTLYDYMRLWDKCFNYIYIYNI